MYDLKVGDIVTRKSYGGDVPFKIADIIEAEGKKVYVLRGLLYRLHADSLAEDLVKQSTRDIYLNMQRNIVDIKRHAYVRGSSRRLPLFGRFRSKTGRILHIDSSKEFMDMCTKHYRDAGLIAIGANISESEQPGAVRRLLQRSGADIVVLTGHDSMKKNKIGRDSMDNYSNSKYFVESVKEARIFEPDMDKLCVYAGACQSYFESIMAAGANFASSPGRVLINALDPAFVAEKVALTDHRSMVTPGQIAEITVSGSDGIGGINTKGHFNM